MLSTTNSPVTNFIAMILMLTGIGRLPAFLVPTDCLRSLENRPPFHRAFRQYVGNPEAVCRLYDKERQRSDGSRPVYVSTIVTFDKFFYLSM